MFRLISVILLFVSTALIAQPKELYWEDLAPLEYQQTTPPLNHDGSSMQQPHLNAPVLQIYDGMQVKIPGFVVPLEGDGKLVTEFLLVPYFGACIHVPPPPPNQIVYVKFSEGVPIANIQDAIWVEGIFSSEGWTGEVATVGYSLQGTKVSPF